MAGPLSNYGCLNCVRTHSLHRQSMKVEAHEKSLKYLLSKRRELGPGSFGKFSWLNITSAEREKLYEIGEQSDLLTQYEFSGVKSAGTSHNDAARRVLDMAHGRAFS